MKRTLQRILGVFGYQLARKNQVVTTRFGADLCADINRLRSNPDFAGRLGKNDIRTVFDVGANEGLQSLAFVRAFPAAVVHAFEPVPDTFRKLEEATRDQPRIRRVSSALGDHEGELTLHLFDGSVYSTAVSAHALMSATGSGRRIAVPVETCDAYCRRHGISHIDLLKIDTEGFDLHVLRGAEQMLRGGYVTLVYFEFFRVAAVDAAEQGGILMDVHAFLTACGYRPVTFYTDYISPKHTGGVYNALYMVWREPAKV